MLPREAPRPAIVDRTGRPLGSVAYWPMRWMRRAGFTLFFVGFVIVELGPHSGAVWPWQTAGLLLCAGGLFVYIGLPGALVVLRHPLAATMRQMLEQGFRHPRLMGLAQVWAGIFMSYWVCALLLRQLPSTPVFLPYALLLVGVGPWLVLVLFDRRR
jgi:hypothetical protein